MIEYAGADDDDDEDGGGGGDDDDDLARGCEGSVKKKVVNFKKEE